MDTHKNQGKVGRKTHVQKDKQSRTSKVSEMNTLVDS